MPTVVAPACPVRRPAGPPVARFRADQLLVDTDHLLDVVRRLWRAGVEITRAEEHDALGTTQLWLQSGERSLLEVLDRTMVADGLWRAGAVERHERPVRRQSEDVVDAHHAGSPQAVGDHRAVQHLEQAAFA